MDFESVYDPQFLLDVDAAENYFNKLANAINLLTPEASINDTIDLNYDIATIYITEGDSVIALVEDEFGNFETVLISSNSDNIEDVLLTDENGDEYIVTRDGEIMGVDEYLETEGKSNKLSDYNKDKEENQLSASLQIEFSPYENQNYGFDAYTEKKTTIQSNYTALNNGYRPAWKSLSSFKNDKVVVSNSGAGISFRDEYGIPALVTGSELNLQGSSGGTEKALYAYKTLNDSTEEIVGKLRLVSYDDEVKKLYIIPVNDPLDFTPETLQESLKAIYKQAAISWDVQVLDQINVTSFENEEMTHGGSSILSPYNTDQKEIVRIFTENRELEDDAYYLFFIRNVQDKDRNIAGYMPFQRQVGFIYETPNLQTIAHELSHGAFNLYHTFSDDNYIAPEGSTQNLMDYTGGTELWKTQWDLIKSPNKLLFTWAQDEEEGESPYLATYEQYITRLVKLFRCAYKSEGTFSLPTPAFKFFNKDIIVSDVVLDGNEYTLWVEFKSDIINYSPKKKTWYNDEYSGLITLEFEEFYIRMQYGDAGIFSDYLYPEKGTADSEIDNTLQDIKSKIASGNFDEVVEQLFSESKCILKGLSFDDKFKLLEYIGGLPIIEDRIDYTVVDILTSISESTDESKLFIDKIESSETVGNKLINSLYHGVSDEYTREAFASNVLLIFSNYWKGKEISVADAEKYFVQNSSGRYTVGDVETYKDAIYVGFTLYNDDGNHEAVICNALEPVVLIELANSVDEEDIIINVPAIYLHYMEESVYTNNIKEFLIDGINVVAIASSVGLVYRGATVIQKVIGIVELANVATTIILNDPVIRAKVSTTPEGIAFLEAWPTISIVTSLVTISTYNLNLFAQNGRKVLTDCDNFIPELEKQRIKIVVEECENVVKSRSTLLTSLDDLPLNIRNVVANFEDDALKS